MNGIEEPAESIDTGQMGFVTLQILGFCLIIMAVGGIGLDLWRGYAVQRELTDVVDAAAAAGATAVDEDHYRYNEEVRLVPAVAGQRACEIVVRRITNASMADCLNNHVRLTDGQTISVEYERDVPLTLMRLLNPGSDVFTVRAESSASPR